MKTETLTEAEIHLVYSEITEIISVALAEYIGTVLSDPEKGEMGRGSLGGPCNPQLKLDFILSAVGSLWRALCRGCVCGYVAGMPVCPDRSFLRITLATVVLLPSVGIV